MIERKAYQVSAHRLRLAFRWIFALIPLLFLAELFARFGVGLGTPPLYQAHPRIEYLLKPNQDISRFGNRVFVNAYGMRSQNFANAKSIDVSELRIMFFGDSILNGGSLTDHSELATTLVRDRLAREAGRKVIVGNISAGSWGPGNWLAYAREFGFFDADVVAVVVSSHDAEDSPTFAPLDTNLQPQRAPLFALSEAVSRYLPRYLPMRRQEIQDEKSVSARRRLQTSISAQRQALSDLRDFLELAKNEVPRVLVFQYPERGELRPINPAPGHDGVAAVTHGLKVEIISVHPKLDAALSEGVNPYRDYIHLNSEGQRILADVFYEALAGMGR